MVETQDGSVEGLPSERGERGDGAVAEQSRFGLEPKIALISHSDFGSADTPSSLKMREALRLLQERAPDLEVDGEMQADTALSLVARQRVITNSRLEGEANVLIFPDLNSGNIASKLIQHIARANAYGQILLGLDRPAADVSRGSNAHDILGVASIIGLQSIEYQKLYPGAGETLPGE